MLDEVQIFSRALSASEIAGVYNASIAGLLHRSAASDQRRLAQDPRRAGDFDIPLPLTGAPGVECRSGDSKRSSSPSTTSSLTASATRERRQHHRYAHASAAKTMTIHLTGVPNAQSLTINLSDLTDAFGQTLPSVVVPMNVLLG